MKIKKCPLALRELTDIDGCLGVDAHAFERGMMSHRRNDQRAGVFKADESAVEQMIDRRREKKPVLAIQSLFVRGVPPRFAVAGDQVYRVGDSRNSAAALDLHNPLFEKPLAAASPDNGFPIRHRNCGVSLDPVLDLMLPPVQVVGRLHRCAHR